MGDVGLRGACSSGYIESDGTNKLSRAQTGDLELWERGEGGGEGSQTMS